MFGFCNPAEHPGVSFSRVLNSEQLVASTTGRFLALETELLHQDFFATQIIEDVGNPIITQELERRDRKDPLSPAGVATDKHQLALAQRIVAPPQKVLELRRFPVLVNPHDRGVQVVSRILEVVRVTAEERGCRFGGPNQSNVGVLLVTIEVILGAAKQASPHRCEVPSSQATLFRLSRSQLAVA